MAVVLETLIVPRASVVPSASLNPVAGASISRCSSIRFSQFRGLKIQQNQRVAPVSSTCKLARRGSRIVCEAQETAFEGLKFFSSFCLSFLSVEDGFLTITGN